MQYHMPIAVHVGVADAPLGTPSPGGAPRGWYDRNYLPHHDEANLRQTITYHLADSLPAKVLTRLQTELDRVPEELQDAERRKRLDAWLDAGHGSCILRRPEVADCVVNTWRRFDSERYDLIAWVVMPNHVHVLIRAYPGVTLGKIVQSWKSFTGKRIRKIMGDEEIRRAGARRSQEGTTPGGAPQAGGRVWMREYWDRTIRDEKHFQAAVTYIHANPVKAGLVSSPEAWVWSSAWNGRNRHPGTPSPCSANPDAPSRGSAFPGDDDPKGNPC